MGFKAPNYTQVPNDFLDNWLPKLGLAETKVLLVIFRKTFGWHKVRDQISLCQFEKSTGLERRHILRAINSLIQKNLVRKFVTGKSGEQQTFYELVIDDSNNSYQCPNDTPPSVPRTPTKERIKETSKNKITSGTDKPKTEAPKKAKKEEIASGEEAERCLKSDKLKDPPDPMREDFEKLPKSLQESVMRLALECKPFIASKLLGTVRDGKKIYNHEKFEDKVIRQTLESQLSKKRKKETQTKKKFKG